MENSNCSLDKPFNLNADSAHEDSEPQPQRRWRWLRGLLVTLQFLYLIRFPLLTFLFLAFFAPFVLCGGIYQCAAPNQLLGNLYDLNASNMLWFSFFSFLLGATALTTLQLIIKYSSERFNFEKNATELTDHWAAKFLLSNRAFVLAVLFPLLTLSGAYSFEHSAWTWRKFGAGFIGLILAGVVVFVVEWIGSRKMFRTDFPRRIGTWLNQKFSEYHTRGYVGIENGETVFYSGHLSALILSFVFFIFVYLPVGLIWRLNFFPQNITVGISAISYLILLITVLCWLLSALAFFFDRYRVPVLVLVGALIGFSSYCSRNDDYYNFKKLSEQEEKNENVNKPIAPAEAFRSIFKGVTPTATPTAENKETAENEYVILVAADGGGIQAAAWTAQVLTGLEQACREKFGAKFSDGNFRGCADRIRLISSVSGGSVGAMHFLNAYKQEKGLIADKRGLRKIYCDAVQSSLDEVAWGVAYPDLLRTFYPFPYPPLKFGRGQALEEVWLKRSCRKDETGAENCDFGKPLSSWRAGVRDGWRPANIFNAAVAETGDSLLIGTTRVEAANKLGSADDCNPPSKSGGRWNYYDFNRCNDKSAPNDIAIATAVRLSATFPYVTPAPRADDDHQTQKNYRNSYHIVDGGYYDNYGISSLSAWLNEALSHQRSSLSSQNTLPSKRITKILLVEIRANSLSEKEAEASSGWYYQVLAPLYTLYSVRVTGQLAHNETELQILKNYWNEQKPKVEIERAIFQYSNDDTEKTSPHPSDDTEKTSPLSWRLSDSQSREIYDSWSSILRGKDKEKGWLTFAEFIKARYGDKLKDVKAEFVDIDKEPVDCRTFYNEQPR